VSEGEAADAMYIIQEGQVRITKRLPPQQQQSQRQLDVGAMEAGAAGVGDTRAAMVLDHLHAGFYFGEAAMVTGGVRSATVTATTSVVLLRLDREACFETLGSVRRFFEREAARRAHQNELVESVLGWLAARAPNRRHSAARRSRSAHTPPLLRTLLAFAERAHALERTCVARAASSTFFAR
jgi:CRP-like cAMP-binding protein